MTTRVSQYQKGKTNLEFTEARNSEWQWHPLGHMQVCTSLQTANQASTASLSFFTRRMPFLPPNQQRQSTFMAVNSLYCADVPLRNCSLTLTIWSTLCCLPHAHTWANARCWVLQYDAITFQLCQWHTALLSGTWFACRKHDLRMTSEQSCWKTGCSHFAYNLLNAQLV